MKKVLTGMLIVFMIITLLPENLIEKSCIKVEVMAAESLKNPDIVTDSSMQSGRKVIYDCVWFGSYPQTEIVDQASTCGTYKKTWALSSDYEANTTLYSTLENSDKWDANGDVVIADVKYRRIKSEDATYSESTSSYYKWNSTEKYHYFRYEPIKWRVLEVNESQALLLADIILDSQRYNAVTTDMTWKYSTIRSWLNGYGPSVNTYSMDYATNSFISRAFSSDEIKAIDATVLDNKTTSRYSEQYGGDNTTDKIFLLSSYDVFNSDNAVSHGFLKGNSEDEARRRKSSTFAKAMGISVYGDMERVKGISSWWLRSPGQYANTAVYVAPPLSTLNYSGVSIVQGNIGICPALYLDISATSLYNYAGTVCTDGTVDEEGGSDTPQTYTVTYNSNGGSGAPADQIKTEGIRLILSSTCPEREGYDFVGWATSPSSTIPDYKAGGSYTDNADLTLYAVWEKWSEESGGSEGDGSGGKDNSSHNEMIPSTKNSQVITATDRTVVIKSASFKLGAKTSGDGKLTYSSSSNTVASISSTGLVTPKNYGSAIITIVASETATYKAATKKITVTVVPKKVKIKSLKSPSKGALLLKWSKDKTASGYLLEIAMNKKWGKRGYSATLDLHRVGKTGYLRPIGGKKTKDGVTRLYDLKRKKKWYVRIRAYKTVGDKKCIGPVSLVKKIKVK